MPRMRTLFAPVVFTALLAASAACSAVPANESNDVAAPSGETSPASLVANSAARPGAPVHAYKYVDDSTKPLSVGPACASPNLQYGGGQVISNVEIVQVTWGSSVDPKIVSLFESWYPAIVASPHISWLSEYDTSGGQHIGLGTYKKNPASAGAWQITPANTATALQDSDVGTEIVAQIAAGHLPAPTKDAKGNSNTLYMIDFPPGVSITLDFFSTSCKAGGFCGYHTTTTTSAGDKVYYGVHPDMSAGSGCAPGAGKWHCGGSLDEYQGAAVVHAHEMVEAITDPESNSAWVDSNSGCGEIGDICANQLGSCDASTCLSPSVGGLNISGTNYYVQTEWSNAKKDCIVSIGGTPLEDAGPDSAPGLDSSVPEIDAGLDASVGPDATTGTDAGHPADSGSGADGAVHTDSGMQAQDSGNPSGDSGNPIGFVDSGNPTGNTDSGGPLTDDGGQSAGDASSSGDNGTGNSSGCGCVVAGGGERSQVGALGGLLFGLAILARRRRARR